MKMNEGLKLILIIVVGFILLNITIDKFLAFIGVDGYNRFT